MRTFLFTLGLLAATGFVTNAFAQDPVAVSPNIYKVLLDNDQVRVLEIHLKPGEKSPMHSHPNSIVYALSTGTLRFTGEDGKTNDSKLEKGQCLWRPAERHEPENIGKTEVHAIQIELKK